jgi:hypothetical protein
VFIRGLKKWMIIDVTKRCQAASTISNLSKFMLDSAAYRVFMVFAPHLALCGTFYSN